METSRRLDHATGGAAAASRDPARRLQALAEISRLITLGRDERAILQHVTEAVGRLLDSPYAGLWMVDDATRDLVLVATSGPLTDAMEIGARRAAGTINLNEAVLEGGRLFQTSDVEADPRWVNYAMTRRFGLKTYLGVPLAVGERRYGIMALLFREQRTFDGDDLELVETIAAQAAAALANARAYGRLATLAEVSHLVASNLDPRAVLDAAVQATARLIGVQDVRLWLYDPSTDLFRLGARVPPVDSPQEITMPVAGTVSGSVLRDGRPLVVDDLATRPLYSGPGLEPDRWASALLVPFAHQERALGVLVALSALRRTFVEDDVQLLRTLAAQVAVATENARLFEDARRQARQLATILDVNKRLALGPRLEEILARISEEATLLLAADGAIVWMIEGYALVSAVASGSAEAELAEWADQRRIGERLSARVVAEGRPIISTVRSNQVRPDQPDRARPADPDAHSWLGVPLRGPDGVVGVLTIVRGDERRFGAADVRLLEAFADQAALAIENASLFATTERRADEATAVAEVGRAITSSLDLQAVLDLIVDQACRLLRTERSALAIAEPEGADSIFRFVALRGLSQEFVDRIRPRHRRDGTTAAAIVERRPVWSADLLNDPAFELSPSTRAGVAAEGYRAVLSVPLLAADQTLGALAVYRDAVGTFSTDEVELLRVFADQAAIAVANARVFQREQARRRQLEAIRDVSAEITRELDLTALLELIIRRSADLVEAGSGTVYLWDEAEAALIPRAWSGIGAWISDVRLELGEGVVGMAAERRRGLIVNDYRTSGLAARAVLEQSKLDAVLAEPILYQDRLVGVIALGREGTGRPYTEQDRELLGLFADQAAIAIENVRLFERAAALQAESELNRLKSEFLSTASHELRTPLSLIRGYASLLMLRAETLSRDQLAEMVSAIHTGSTTMTRLVDDLLDFSRLERGLLQLDRSRVVLAEVLGPLVEAFRAQPGGERIVTDLPPSVEADLDRDRLTQIVSNLLTNSIRYAPSGPILLSARRDGDEVRVEVTDHGPGITRAELPRIWEKFYRTQYALNSSNRGSGLGLAVVKQLVELHGGRVGVRSAPREGTTFWFVLPVTDPASPPEAGQQDDDPAP